ncbi:hypothetical protein [Marinoscillum sp.]|uniref:RipA family octameric membrane protein n=1 Tax=Marinoscillum sp. TaxID=2024838 RepID=UPI003BAD2952
MSKKITESKEKDKTTENIEVIKFLIECSYKEGTLFWNRNSVFLLANLATFSAAFAYFTGSDEPIHWAIRIGVGVFGAILCIIWILVIQAGRRMNHIWVHEARKLAHNADQKEILNALNGVPSGSISKGKIQSATILMYWLAIVFMMVWIFASLIGKGGII